MRQQLFGFFQIYKITMANVSNVMNITEPDTDLAAEVLWCVQHIEMILNQGKLGEKKTKEARISRKLLKNPDTPLVKKRQAMRNSCGDYRAKMRAEERETKLENERIKVGKVKVKKHTFIKKSVVKASDQSEKAEFKFNFNVQT